MTVLTSHHDPLLELTANAVKRLLSRTSVEAEQYLVICQHAFEAVLDLQRLDFLRIVGPHEHGVVVVPSYATRAAVAGTIPGISVVEDGQVNRPQTLRQRLVSDLPSADALRLLFVRSAGIAASNIVDANDTRVLTGVDTFARQFPTNNASMANGAGLSEHFRGITSETVTHLLGWPSGDGEVKEPEKLQRIYYLALLLTGHHSEHSHDLGGGRDSIDDHALRMVGAMGWRAAASRILASAADLSDSLRSVALVPGRPLRILLVDDEKSGDGVPEYADLFLRILKVFFGPESELATWNPCSAGQAEARGMVAGYASLYGGRTRAVEVALRKLWVGDDGHLSVSAPENVRVDALNAKFDYVFVDQLYKFHTVDASRGGSQVLGPALIRGLTRLFRDVASTPSVPEIIAISRDDQPDILQSAIRAGARDYLPKSRLLALPALLYRLIRARAAAAPELHRNFPEVYRLDNETQALLKSARVPNLGPLHRGPLSSELRQKQQSVAKILQSIPKTDLHVHAGSCMSPEFLVVASSVLLAQELFRSESAPTSASVSSATVDVWFRSCQDIAAAVTTLRSGGRWLWNFIVPGRAPAANSYPVETRRQQTWIHHAAASIRGALLPEVENADWSDYQAFRGLLHRELSIRDRLLRHEAKSAINALADLEVVLFALRHHERHRRGSDLWSRADCVRILLLTLAANDSAYAADGRTQPALEWAGDDLLELFRGGTIEERTRRAWVEFACGMFGQDSEVSAPELRSRGWRLTDGVEGLMLHMGRTGDLGAGAADERARVLETTIATGRRANNLNDYLEGCEFSGAEHLRHPLLMHLYAQQVVIDFIRQGVLYSELRAAPDGYVNAGIGMDFRHVCNCMEVAFTQAQTIAVDLFEGREPSGRWVAGVLGPKYEQFVLRRVLEDGAFPTKVGLLFVGKRHKALHEIILEAAAAAVMRPPAMQPVGNAAEFVRRELSRCRIVGFDLAGKEVGNPPERFVDEFARLARLHIPLTVHAGENESASFIEDSILRLKARRIGHGLSLTEDPALLARVREEKVGIELCPSSNFQTSHFGPPGARHGREYPLRHLVSEGVLVSINTDNPIISGTDIVQEFFQASYAWGGDGLPLWDALRLIRMGFVMSFMGLKERRAALELVGQRVFDIFSDPATKDVLRSLIQRSDD
jgi:adenosine deaminase/DNA-binding NarL/FixJ family response regulator